MEIVPLSAGASWVEGGYLTRIVDVSADGPLPQLTQLRLRRDVQPTA